MRAKLEIVVALVFLIEPQLALASPPPPIMPGTPEALRTCLAGGVYGVRSQKETFYTTKTDLPLQLAGFAGKGGDFAFRLCLDNDGNSHYFARYAAGKDLPVCEVIEREVFRDPTGIGQMALPVVDGSANHDSVWISGWLPKPPEEWLNRGYRDAGPPMTLLARLKNGPCPLGDDPGYVHIYNTPPGVFKGIAEAIKNDRDHALGGTMTVVRCEDAGCFAGLSTGKTVILDVGAKGVIITGVEPYID